MPTDLRERLEHLIQQELDRRGLSRMRPTVMFREEKICFRLSDPKTKGIREWSEWLSEENLERSVALVDQVRALLLALAFDCELMDDSKTTSHTL